MKHVLAQRRHSRRIPSVVSQIGNTPLVKIRNITRDLPRSVEIYAKLEYFNPGGSVKDRSVYQIISDAEADGRLTPDKVLIDSTIGSAGIAYSMLGASLGYKIELVMPVNACERRRRFVLAFGAEVIDSDPADKSDGAIRLARDMVEADRASGRERYFYANQYDNPSSPKAHYLTTGAEIWKATKNRVTHFVAGVGTGGTLMGTGRRLKICNPEIQMVAVEPSEELHGLEGLRHYESSIAPGIYKVAEVDRRVAVDTDAGWDMTVQLAREEGLFVGYSSGAAMVAALEVARDLDRGMVVVLFADHADRYV